MEGGREGKDGRRGRESVLEAKKKKKKSRGDDEEAGEKHTGRDLRED